MRVIICVDDDFGIAFNNRRQSQDRELTKEIKRIVGDATLYISEYSISLFEGSGINYQIINEEMDENGFVFFERMNPDSIQIDELFMVKWNRRYPSDVKLEIDLLKYEKINEYSFVGSSHEKITIEEWRKQDE